MSQAEHLLIGTDFTMGQIAQMIGYSTSSRFAERFKKNAGIFHCVPKDCPERPMSRCCARALCVVTVEKFMHHG